MTTPQKPESEVPADEQVVWFHGTSLENARSIEIEGFKSGTWFARHMEDAIEFGGPCVFLVNVRFSTTSLDKWQVCCDNDLPVTSIRKRVDFVAEKPESEVPSAEQFWKTWVETLPLCDTTSTPRFPLDKCKCGTYPGNLGPCLEFVDGPNGRCPYCAHKIECHRYALPVFARAYAAQAVEAAIEKIRNDPATTLLGFSLTHIQRALHLEQSLRRSEDGTEVPSAEQWLAHKYLLKLETIRNMPALREEAQRLRDYAAQAVEAATQEAIESTSSLWEMTAEATCWRLQQRIAELAEENERLTQRIAELEK